MPNISLFKISGTEPSNDNVLAQFFHREVSDVFPIKTSLKSPENTKLQIFQRVIPSPVQISCPKWIHRPENRIVNYTVQNSQKTINSIRFILIPVSNHFLIYNTSHWYHSITCQNQAFGLSARSLIENRSEQKTPSLPSINHKLDKYVHSWPGSPDRVVVNITGKMLWEIAEASLAPTGKRISVPDIGPKDGRPGPRSIWRRILVGPNINPRPCLRNSDTYRQGCGRKTRWNSST